MKKVILLLLVAAGIGTATFFFAAKFFKARQLQTRIREMGGMINNMSSATQTAMDRNWWAGMMPPSDADIPAADYKPGVSFGRQEWYSIWAEDAGDDPGRLVRRIENFTVGEPATEPRFADFDGTPVTWTWHQGVPGRWGQRVNMSAMFIYEMQDWKIARLELLSKTENTEPPAADSN